MGAGRARNMRWRSATLPSASCVIAVIQSKVDRAYEQALAEEERAAAQVERMLQLAESGHVAQEVCVRLVAVLRVRRARVGAVAVASAASRARPASRRSTSRTPRQLGGASRGSRGSEQAWPESCRREVAMAAAASVLLPWRSCQQRRSPTCRGPRAPLVLATRACARCNPRSVGRPRRSQQGALCWRQSGDRAPRGSSWCARERRVAAPPRSRGPGCRHDGAADRPRSDG